MRVHFSLARYTLVYIIFNLLFFAVTSVGYAISYEYDSLDRLTRVVYDSGKFVTYTYDAAGNLLRVHTEVPLEAIADLRVEPTEIELSLGEKQDMHVYILYKDGSDEEVTKEAEYRVEDPSVVRVEKGKIEGLAVGETGVTVSYWEREAKIKVKVVEKKADAPSTGQLPGKSTGPGSGDAVPVTTPPGDQTGKQEAPGSSPKVPGDRAKEIPGGSSGDRGGSILRTGYVWGAAALAAMGVALVAGGAWLVRKRS